MSGGRGLLALVVALAGCGEAPRAPFGEEEEAPGLVPAPTTARSPCPGSDEAFVFRALRLIAGRRPAGVRELELLAAMIRALDDAGLPGRRTIAEGLARGPRYEQRWQDFLRDHLRVPRLGSTSDPGCHGHPGPAAEGPALAAFIAAHGPEEAVPADMSGWSMADLLASAVALDDLRPLLRAQLLARQARPIGGNNVAPAELERARRVFLGRGFEAAYLGRRLECLPCHHSDFSVTDHAEAALDRSWPAVAGLEAAVYGPPATAREDELYAGFRVHGFVEGSLAPWGGRACGTVDPGRGGDLLGVAGSLAGPLPAGAHALDVEARLRAGFERLAEIDLTDAGAEPEAALAGLVALNLADAVWRAASGRPLTLPHGQPRNAAQRAVLRELAQALARGGFSLRALVVAAALHPYLDLDQPGRCAGALPPVLDPFLAANDAGDGLRREDPWTLLDTAAQALGWRLPRRFPLPFGWEDEALMRSLGVFLDESEPGHRGLDLVGALAWERSVGAGADPGWAGPAPRDHVAGADVIARLGAAARAGMFTVEDAALAVQDRVIQETAWVDAAQRDEVEALLGLPLASRAAAHAPEVLEAALRRLAGALLMAPQFTLAGLTPPPWTRAPRLVLPEATTAALCELHAGPMLGASGLAWPCDEAGLQLDDAPR